MLEIGSIIGGKFRIERILGQGGMGLVAVATHLQLDQLVALKVLRDPMLADAEAIERFMREARASARLRSEHVCKVSDVGQLEDGTPYLVMELLEGADLAVVAADGPLPIELACEYVLQACVAIAEAHAQGIVHRDLKPANLFLTRRLDGSPLVKVLDFGIAKAAAGSDFKITKTSTVMGSPGYMSPEQLRSAKDADTRSDIWALGVILYELVTGRLPFSGESITELAVKVVVDPHEPLGIDAPAFTAVVERCLAKEPDQRYIDITGLAADLAPLVGEGANKTALLVATLNHAAPRTGASTSMPPMGAVSGSAMTQASGEMAAVAGASRAMQLAASRPTAMAPSAIGTAQASRAIGTAPTMSPAASALVEAATRPRRRRPVALALAIVGVAAVAAAAAVLIVREPHGKPHHKEPKGSAVVATPPPDAAVPDAAIPDAAPAVDYTAEVRTNLRELVIKQDWPGVLAFEDMAKQDPEIAEITADARKQYVAQQAHAIDAQVKAGNCARARQLAAAALQLVADDTTLAPKAKACKPHAAPAPVVPVTPPKPTPDELDETMDDLASARADQRAGHWGAALTEAQRALHQQPHNLIAQNIALTAACQLGKADLARELFGRMPRLRAQHFRQLCLAHGVEL